MRLPFNWRNMFLKFFLLVCAKFLNNNICKKTYVLLLSLLRNKNNLRTLGTRLKYKSFPLFLVQQTIKQKVAQKLNCFAYVIV